MPRLVLIDDDPLFGNIVVRVASAQGIEIDYFASLSEMGFVGRLGEYDVAIVDYDLGSMTGIEIAEYLKVFFGDIPMVLVSAAPREQPLAKRWPESVRAFVPKQAGYEAILAAALACVGEPRDRPVGPRVPHVSTFDHVVH